MGKEARTLAREITAVHRSRRRGRRGGRSPLPLGLLLHGAQVVDFIAHPLELSEALLLVFLLASGLLEDVARVMEDTTVRDLANDSLLAHEFRLVLFVEDAVEHGLAERIMLSSLDLVISVLSAVLHDLLEVRAAHVALFFVEVVPDIVEDVEDLALDGRVERLAMDRWFLADWWLWSRAVQGVLVEHGSGSRGTHLSGRDGRLALHRCVDRLVLNTVAVLIDLRNDRLSQLAPFRWVSDLVGFAELVDSLRRVLVGVHIQRHLALVSQIHIDDHFNIALNLSGPRSLLHACCCRWQVRRIALVQELRERLLGAHDDVTVSRHRYLLLNFLLRRVIEEFCLLGRLELLDGQVEANIRLLHSQLRLLHRGLLDLRHHDFLLLFIIR